MCVFFSVKPDPGKSTCPTGAHTEAKNTSGHMSGHRKLPDREQAGEQRQPPLTATNTTREIRRALREPAHAETHSRTQAPIPDTPTLKPNNTKPVC
jgi:hypothetical protein